MNAFARNNVITATPTEVTFKVYTAELPEVREAVAKLAKKLVKKGYPAPVALVEGETSTVRRETVSGYGYSVEKTEVTLHYPQLKVNGWSFLAKAEQLPLSTEVVTSVAPEFQGEDLGARQWDLCRCDHCSTRRARKTVYLLRNEEGEEQQVGSTCLQLFFGVDPVAVVTAFAAIEEILEGFGGDDGFDPDAPRGGRLRAHHCLEYLAFTAMEIEANGWVSKTVAAQQGGWPTSMRVNNSIFNKKDPKQEQPSPANWETAKAALEWAQSLPRDGSDYERNAGAIARAGLLPYDKDGLGASIVGCYLRNVAKEAEKAAREKVEKLTPAHFGSVGKRQVISPVTFVSSMVFDSFYGAKTLAKFQGALDDKTSCTFVWWASGCPDLPEEGERVSLKATIKAHEDGKYGKQTVLSRVVITPF